MTNDSKKAALDAVNRQFLLEHSSQAADLIDRFGRAATVELLADHQPDAVAAVWRHWSPARIDEIVPALPDKLLRQVLVALDPSVTAI